MAEYCWEDGVGAEDIDGGAWAEFEANLESVDACAAFLIEALGEGIDAGLFLPSNLDRTRDFCRIGALFFPKFFCSQFGSARYFLPQPVLAKARGICLCRASDELVEVEMSSEVGEGFMLVFAWWYIGSCARETRKLWKRKATEDEQGMSDQNDIAVGAKYACLV